MSKTTCARLTRSAAVAATCIAAAAAWSCSKDVQALSPQQIEQQYGVSGAYSDTVATPDGSIRGTVVPPAVFDEARRLRDEYRAAPGKGAVGSGG